MVDREATTLPVVVAVASGGLTVKADAPSKVLRAMTARRGAKVFIVQMQ